MYVCVSVCLLVSVFVYKNVRLFSLSEATSLGEGKL